MTTSKIDVTHTPMDPLYIVGFLSKSSLDKSSVKCMVKALKEYHKKCAAAAIALDKELKKCLNNHVQIRESSTKK
jgi:hypothetical protein